VIVADFINTVDIVGDDALTDSIIYRSITEFNDNLITSIGLYALYQCTALTSVNLPNVTSIYGNAFGGCSSLTTIILRSPTVCTLADRSAFSSTPFASNGTGGTAYVPQALISQYQTATNWSSLYASGKCNFVAI
jgi:hypothetical protein